MIPHSLDAYPLRLFAKDMAEIFRVSLKRFYALDEEGAFLWAEHRPRLGRKSYSREIVGEYLAGKPIGLTDPRRRLKEGARTDRRLRTAS